MGDHHLDDNHITAHSTQGSSPAKDNPKLLSNIVENLHDIHHLISQHQLIPQNILAWNVTSLWSNSTVHQSYAPANLYVQALILVIIVFSSHFLNYLNLIIFYTAALLGSGLGIEITRT